MAKKPNASAVTRILQNSGQTKAVEYMGDYYGRYSGPSNIKGFNVQKIANGELAISAPVSEPHHNSPNYEERVQEANARQSRLLHFYGETLKNKGYETAHRTTWNKKSGSAIKRMVVVNPDLVYGPPKPPELEQ